MTSVRQVQQLTADVWDAAMAARDAARYVDHPDNYSAVYGTSRYTMEAMLLAAFNAGRKTAYDGGEVEWGVQVASNRALAYHGNYEGEARDKLAHAAQHVGQWEVADAS